MQKDVTSQNTFKLLMLKAQHYSKENRPSHKHKSWSTRFSYYHKKFRTSLS